MIQSTFTSRPQHYVNLMLLAVVHQFDHALWNCSSIDRHASDVPTGPPCVLDNDMVSGRAMTVCDFVTGPVGRDAGIKLEPSAPQMKTKDRFQADSVEPRGRTRIPGPASAASVWWRAVDVRADHVRLHLVTFHAIGRSSVPDWVEHFE